MGIFISETKDYVFYTVYIEMFKEMNMIRNTNDNHQGEEAKVGPVPNQQPPKLGRGHEIASQE